MCYDFSALTLDDERKMISNLISGFVRNISFGRDFEQQLSFYVECRASFSNLDQVLVQLIQVRIRLFLKKKISMHVIFLYELLCFVFFPLSFTLCFVSECKQFIHGNKESCQGKSLQKNRQLCQGKNI